MVGEENISGIEIMILEEVAQINLENFCRGISSCCIKGYLILFSATLRFCGLL
jgi:hypothetical protein